MTLWTHEQWFKANCRGDRVVLRTTFVVLHLLGGRQSVAQAPRARRDLHLDPIVDSFALDMANGATIDAPSRVTCGAP